MLHPAVQKQLWQMGWPALRPLQESAIQQILREEGHAILTAATAAGKTEAAFLPVLSRIADEPPGSVRAIYVGPLKALINDQFSRVQELCKFLEIPVHSWHGDVTATAKNELLKNPAGVLLITPESLESLFVNHWQKLPQLLGGVRFVVIDEMHSFLDTERGLHLQSLLMRLREISMPPARSIGLSATIGDENVAKKWIDLDRPEGVAIVSDTPEPKEIKFRLHGYVIERETEENHEQGQKSEAGPEAQESKVSSADDRLANDLVRHCAGHVNLIFANSKADVETFADLCGDIARRENLPDLFLVHHGSLSAELRHDAEEALKSGKPVTGFCSSTLEMGIDIGAVRLVGQIGAPSSVASMKQRLGRSGRKGTDPRMMRLYLRCRQPKIDANLFDRLHLNLLQAIAASDLLLSGWVEPPQSATCDLSTLSQQIISVIAQTSGIDAASIYQRLCAAGAFRSIEPALFAKLLRSLAAKDIIEQLPTGELILGLAGETLRKDKSFYAVFQTPEQFRVIADGQCIGELSMVPRAGEQLLLAGRRWELVDVDSAHRELHVKASAGGSKSVFLGDGATVHVRIRARMREILRETTTPAFLDATAAGLLEESRQAAVNAELVSDARDIDDAPISGDAPMPVSPLIPILSGGTAWFTWAGSRAQDTLIAMLTDQKIKVRDRGVAILFDEPPADVAELIAKMIDANASPEKLAEYVQPRRRRKYDAFLTDELLNISNARDRLDVAGARLIAAAVALD